MPDYPILQQNKPIGTLTVTQEGLFTVFSARAKTNADRLRLAVCGERSRAYLGLMLPDGSGWLTLRRRLTRLERARLPEPILFAADETWDIPDAPARPPDPPRAQKAAPDAETEDTHSPDISGRGLPAVDRPILHRRPASCG